MRHCGARHACTAAAGGTGVRGGRDGAGSPRAGKPSAGAASSHPFPQGGLRERRGPQHRVHYQHGGVQRGAVHHAAAVRPPAHLPLGGAVLQHRDGVPPLPPGHCGLDGRAGGRRRAGSDARGGKRKRGARACPGRGACELLCPIRRRSWSKLHARRTARAPAPPASPPTPRGGGGSAAAHSSRCPVGWGPSAATIAPRASPR
mmetsp:Transcript_6000/g.25173  ORF Transcript_6000/g.25173 Transcript_6000/m.25173 type:complete len:203 (+) Transcript_6000:628-1236(+)